jgi:hypothetical protein
LPGDTAEIGFAQVAAAKPKDGTKSRYLTLSDLDSRTKAARRALTLRAGFLVDLGGSDNSSTAQTELAQRGAVLGAMLEDREAKYLSGDGINLTEYCTLVNAQRRVLADIGLERRQKDVLTLDNYLQGNGHD